MELGTSKSVKKSKLKIMLVARQEHNRLLRLVGETKVAFQAASELLDLNL